MWLRELRFRMIIRWFIYWDWILVAWIEIINWFALSLWVMSWEHVAMLSILEIISFKYIIKLISKHDKIVSVDIANFKAGLAFDVLQHFPIILLIIRKIILNYFIGSVRGINELYSFYLFFSVCINSMNLSFKLA